MKTLIFSKLLMALLPIATGGSDELLRVINEEVRILKGHILPLEAVESYHLKRCKSGSLAT